MKLDLVQTKRVQVFIHYSVCVFLDHISTKAQNYFQHYIILFSLPDNSIQPIKTFCPRSFYYSLFRNVRRGHNLEPGFSVWLTSEQQEVECGVTANAVRVPGVGHGHLTLVPWSRLCNTGPPLTGPPTSTRHYHQWNYCLTF